MTFDLPFPPASLSGHNNGRWFNQSGLVKSFREGAQIAAQAASRRAGYSPPLKGDIPILFRFHAPDNRGDRTNYPNRIKPLIDGIADALGVNDRRFLPCYQFCETEKPGRVEVTL